MDGSMVMHRSFKQQVCRVLTGMLLFSQLAVAAYACPGIPAAALFERNQGQSVAAAAAESGMVAAAMGEQANSATLSCEQMDRAVQTDRTTQNLCSEHCKYGQQSADRASTPIPPAVLLTTLYTTPLLSEAAIHIQPLAALEAPPPATSPSRTILHCCFRI
jgi:hypothetical protein